MATSQIGIILISVLQTRLRGCQHSHRDSHPGCLIAKLVLLITHLYSHFTSARLLRWLVTRIVSPRWIVFEQGTWPSAKEWGCYCVCPYSMEPSWGPLKPNPQSHGLFWPCHQSLCTLMSQFGNGINTHKPMTWSYVQVKIFRESQPFWLCAFLVS